MPEYLSPGVYVEEVDTGPKPIEGVGTATAVFIGFTEKAQVTDRIENELVTRDVLNRPQLITNWTQYLSTFGGFADGAYLPQSVYGYFQNGGNRCYVISVKTLPKAKADLLNGEGKGKLLVRAKKAGPEGGRLRVIIDVPKSSAKGKSKDAGESFSPFSITVEREKISGGWQKKETLQDVVLTETIQDDGTKSIRVGYRGNNLPQWIELVVPKKKNSLADLWPRSQSQTLSIPAGALPAPTLQDFEGDVQERTGLSSLQSLEDVTMVVIPDLMTPAPGKNLNLEMVRAFQSAVIAHCEIMGDRVAILDTPPNLKPIEVKEWREETTGFDSSYATMYYPWIQVNDVSSNRTETIPSSGHVAGIWARSDNTRGVHKAPANEVVLGVTSLSFNVSKGEQDVLNPIGVNCIRALPGMGIRVWGARTLSSNPAWRYINVRRLFNFVEKSIELNTQWVVFEPNGQKLWARVSRDINAFLKIVWRSGALFGNSPTEAFYVKCDEELNPPESRDLGRLIVEVGLAPVKPAEFVIFRISQWAGGGMDVEEAGGGGEAEAAVEE